VRLLRRALLLVTCAAFLQCSLLAPDDRYFLGSGGGGGGEGGSGGSDIEVACTAAPACDDAHGEGPTVLVTQDEAGAFPALVANAEPNTTFTLAQGTYALSEVISIKAPGITLQSQPGDAVVLESSTPVAIAVSADDATLRGLTLRGASDSTVLLGGGKDVIIERPRLCNVEIEDGGQSFVLSTADGGWVDCGRIETSVFRLTDASRTSQCARGSIVSAVSVAGGRGWVVTDSDVTDFFCADPSPPVSMRDCDATAVGLTFDLGSRDTIIERTRFLGMSRAIVLGYTTTPTAPRRYADNPYDDGAIDHFDGILRNNLIVGHPLCFDTGIELNHAREPTVLHNTVVYLQEPGYSAIDRRYTETHATLINNLVRGAITYRNNALVQTDVKTVEVDSLTEFLTADYHLLAGASAAIDTGAASDLAGLDVDGEPHSAGRGPDVGADEYTR
jgi:hypothetical protein